MNYRDTRFRAGQIQTFDLENGNQVLPYTITEAQAISHKDCELGKWLYAEGLKKYGDLPSMQELEERHVELHAIMRKVVEMRRGGDKAGAKQEFRRLEPVSKGIIKLLKAAEEQVSKN